jgi:hypothetical protein
MRRMVANRKAVLDQLGHAAAGPNIPKKAVGFGPLFEQLHQLGELGGLSKGAGPGAGWSRKAVTPPKRARWNHWRTAACVTPKACAMCAWVQPR